MQRPLTRLAVLSAIVLLGGAASAHAAIARVFVSVNGNDANACENISTPCRTFAAGIARVDPDGEVIVLETGSYGGTTITKGVRINVPSGVVAFAAQPFVINAPGAVVVLRGLTLKALTFGAGTGITYLAGNALHIESCIVDGWNDGIDINGNGRFFIKDSIVRNTSSFALSVQPPSASLIGTIDNSRFEDVITGTIGVYGGKVTMRNSVVSGNGNGVGAVGDSGITAEVNADKCLFANNSGNGLYAFGAMATARISNSIVTGNNTGLNNIGGGATLKSWGNNAVDGNISNTLGTVTTIALQ